MSRLPERLGSCRRDSISLQTVPWLRLSLKGSFTNCKVTPRADKVARDIYGLAEPILAGKTRKKQAAFSLEIPVVAHMELDQTVYMGLFYWHSEPFILSIAKPLYLVCCLHIDAFVLNSEAIAEESRPCVR